MATGYTISIGYISGYSYKGDKDEAFQELISVVEKLCMHPERIEVEAYQFGTPDYDEGGETRYSYCERYLRRDDGTLTIDQQKQTVFQIASGNRTMKEHIRRAFCRLVIQDMHQKGIEVNLVVA